MSEIDTHSVRQIVFPPAVLKRLEGDAAVNKRTFNDQVIYVLTVGHRELDDRPPIAKRRKGSHRRS